MREEISRAWREVDLNALAYNARTLQAALDSSYYLMAVVKADAYGHGSIPVARRLEAEGVKAFAVACLEEGIALRRSGIQGKILILGYTPPGMAFQICRWKLVQTVADEDHGRALAAQGVPLSVHLALDTGMHRLGIPAEDHKALQHLYELPNLNIEGVFSHLCVSDSLEAEDMSFTCTQLERFYATVRWLKTHGLDTGAIHIQASYGIWNLPPQPCSWARAGIALYGVFSNDAHTERKLDLHPVLSLRARVASVRTLLPGEGAGYALSLLLKINDGFRTEEFRRLGLTGSSGDWERLVRGVIREFEENNSGVGLFHFDSDEDVFCVYSQYIDDLMMLAKMIRVACADEKAMRTYLGKIEYIKLFWEGAPEGEPAVILYEVDTENERLALRSIDIFADCRTRNIPDLYDGAIEIITPIRH